MSKKLPYFQFEPAEYLASDISICSLEAQGLFTLMMSLFWQKDCKLLKDKFLKRYNYPKEFNELIEDKIIKVSADGFIHIKFLELQHHFISSRSKKNSENGKKGAEQRIKNQEVIKPPLTDTSTVAKATPKHLDKIREEKIIYNNNTPPVETGDNESSSLNNQPTAGEKEKESSAKESFNWDGLLNKINTVTGRQFKVINQTVRAKYKERLKDGYTKEDINSAIENAPKTQAHKENNCQYLTPEFFARAETIDKYSAITKSDSEKQVAPAMTKN